MHTIAQGKITNRSWNKQLKNCSVVGRTLLTFWKSIFDVTVKLGFCVLFSSCRHEEVEGKGLAALPLSCSASELSAAETQSKTHQRASQGHSGEEPTCQCRRHGSIPGSGRPPGGGNGTPLQYSCLGNPMDRGVWQGTIHGVTKSQTWLSDCVCTHTQRNEYLSKCLTANW